jgi:hypothetical protein
MFNLFKRRTERPAVHAAVAELSDILSDEPVDSAGDLFRLCQAVEAVAKLGPAAHAAMPALLRTLVMPVRADCWLALRVAAAEAVWKVDGRHDLALPILAWALRDEYWGVSLQAARVLGEMGTAAHAAIPDLVDLAARRSAHGRYHFEEFRSAADRAAGWSCLLAVVATALGRCGRGYPHWYAAHDMLTRLAAADEADARAAAEQALAELGTPDGQPTDAKYQGTVR